MWNILEKKDEIKDNGKESEWSQSGNVFIFTRKECESNCWSFVALAGIMPSLDRTSDCWRSRYLCAKFFKQKNNAKKWNYLELNGKAVCMVCKDIFKCIIEYNHVWI